MRHAVVALVTLLPLAAACAEAGGVDAPDAGAVDMPLLSDGQPMSGDFGEHLGERVATDGVIVAASAADYIAVFARDDNGTWFRAAELRPADDEQALALIAAGDGLILGQVTRSTSRSLVVYEQSLDGWERVADIGTGMREVSWGAISADRIAAAPILAPKDPAQVWVYQRVNTAWQRDVTFEFSGSVFPVAHALWGEEIAFAVHSRPNQPPSSEVRIYRRSEGWAEVARVDLPESAQGYSIDLRGDILAAGQVTNSGGTVLLFRRTSVGTWIEAARRPVDQPPRAVAIATDLIVTSRLADTDNAPPTAFVWDPAAGDDLSQIDDVGFAPSAEDEIYGYATAARGDIVAIGAPGAAPTSSGAVYIHEVLR